MPTIPKPIELPTTTEGKMAKAIELHSMLLCSKDHEGHEALADFVHACWHSEDVRDVYLGWSIAKAWRKACGGSCMSVTGLPYRKAQKTFYGKDYHAMFVETRKRHIKKGDTPKEMKERFERTFPGYSFSDWLKHQGLDIYESHKEAMAKHQG